VHLRDLPLADAWVSSDATLLDASRTLATQGVAAVAVLRPDRTVEGLFTDDDVLRGIFPPYIDELHHTAFAGDVGEVVESQLGRSGGEPVRKYMRRPITVELETSGLHVAERFLHCPWGAVAVVDGGRFVGMLAQVDFVARALDEAQARP
jgi:CBS domain-containing protein